MAGWLTDSLLLAVLSLGSLGRQPQGGDKRNEASMSSG
jgi:hypothetical protein